MHVFISFIQLICSKGLPLDPGDVALNKKDLVSVLLGLMGKSTQNPQDQRISRGWTQSCWRPQKDTPTWA